MTSLENRSDQHPRSLAERIPAQRDRPAPDPVAADDRWVEALRAGRGNNADDPVIRSLARWRAAIIRDT